MLDLHSCIIGMFVCVYSRVRAYYHCKYTGPVSWLARYWFV